MNIETLTTPRVKVLAHYPNSPFKVGEILNAVYDPVSTSTFYELERDIIKIVFKNEVELCPAIFKPLQWWEERSIEDMPEYVKWKNYVSKVNRHFNGSCLIELEKGNYNIAYNHCLPATEQEYLAYINK